MSDPSEWFRMRGMLPLELSRELFPQTRAVIDEAIAQGQTPGLVAAIWSAKTPDQFWQIHAGAKRLHPSRQEMSVDTIFDLASLTKVLGTATLAATLVDRKWISWETHLQAILPDFKFPEIRIKHLLSHTSGFAAWAPLWEQLRDQYQPRPLTEISVAQRQLDTRRLVMEMTPEVPIEQRALYSDIGFILLGYALEEITQLPLDQAIQHFVWNPMGLHGLYFNRVTRLGRQDSKVAATEDSAWRGGVLQGQVHDDNAWAMGGYAGHAGAFGKARDVVEFVKKLYEGFLTPSTLQAVWSRVSQPLGCSRTLGWDTPEGAETSARGFSAHSVGHLGFTGTSLWIDRDAGLAAVLLTNRVHPSRENLGIRILRPRFHEALRRDWENLQ